MYLQNVRKCFGLLEQAEKEIPYFTQAQKQSIYRIAFHKERFKEVRKIVVQAMAPNMDTEDKNRLLKRHLEELPQTPENIEAIEHFIFRLEHMRYEKDKVNQMLEDILSRSGLSQDIDILLAEACGKKTDNKKSDIKSEKMISGVVK